MLAFDQRSAPGDDLVDLFHESHANIRRFLHLGSRLALPPPIDEAEVRALAGMIQHYSVVGLRLVIAEEEALVPYLTGRERTIVKMRTEHAEYSEYLNRLVVLCKQLERDPSPPGGGGRALAQAINAMADCLEPHLAMVERDVLPALDALAPNQRAQIRAAMDARRERASRSDW